MGGVVEQVLVLVLMMAVGFISAKAGIITKQGRGTLTNIVLYVSSPMLVIIPSRCNTARNLLKDMGIVAAFAALSMGAFYLLGLRRSERWATAARRACCGRRRFSATAAIWASPYC